MLLQNKKNKKNIFIIIAISLIFYTTYQYFFKIDKKSQELIIKKINIEYQTLPKDLNGYKIGFISDIHWGQATNKNLLNNIIKKLNTEQIDLLLLGGDYLWFEESFFKRLYMYKRNTLYKNIDYKNAKKTINILYADLAKKLDKIEARDGIIAVYGNHDNLLFPKALKKIFKEKNIQLLSNDIFNIKKRKSFISIYGFEDFLRGSPFIKEKNKIKKNEFKILISHNPDFFSYLDLYYPIPYDLSLSGHTHGGQITVPFLPKATHTYYNKYFNGLSKKNLSYHYTSSGIGFTSLSFRVNVTPEIAVIVLHSRKIKD